MQPTVNSPGLSFFPEQASTFAAQVDYLYFFLVAVSVFFTLLIAGVIVYFAVRYRRRSETDRPPHVETSKTLEIVWSVIPLLIVLVMFFWGAQVFMLQRAEPPGALTISVTGKKWMWKFQHPNGKREINTLHVPVGQPVILRMASEDVIHDVFIPAFRVKQDVLPGRYTTEWFEATKTGIYHLFCNQYCGTQHSNMIGSVIVMEPTSYQAWLAGFTGESPEKAGEALFSKLACNTCHMAGTASRGPDLAGVFGNKVALQNGQVVVADENYIRESILNPQAKVVAGFEPVMPSFQGVVSEEQLTQLVAYIRTLEASGNNSQVGQHGGVIASQEAMANQADSLHSHSGAGETTGSHHSATSQDQAAPAANAEAAPAAQPQTAPSTGAETTTNSQQ